MYRRGLAYCCCKGRTLTAPTLPSPPPRSYCVSNAGQTREVRGGRAVGRYYMLHGSFLQDLLSTAVWLTQVGCHSGAERACPFRMPDRTVALAVCGKRHKLVAAAHCCLVCHYISHA